MQEQNAVNVVWWESSGTFRYGLSASSNSAALNDRSLAALQEDRAYCKAANPWREACAMATTGWQEKVAIGVIPA